MGKLRVLIAAAGRGTRAGLPYPKTLFPIQGKPILHRLLELLAPYDAAPTIVVSPDGKLAIADSLEQAGLKANLVVQPEAKGMGEAVLRFSESPAFADAEHVILVWGDIPFIQHATLDVMVKAHLESASDFTLATRVVPSPYTVLSRDSLGNVEGIVETRELGEEPPENGERDIGLFIFRKALVFSLLKEELPGKWGKTTGEHGFLYVIGNVVARGGSVLALPIASELDLVSLNSLKDVDAYI